MAQYGLVCPQHRAALRAHATSGRYRTHPMAQVLVAALDLIERLEREKTERELRHFTALASAGYAEMLASEFGEAAMMGREAARRGDLRRCAPASGRPARGGIPSRVPRRETRLPVQGRLRRRGYGLSHREGHHRGARFAGVVHHRRRSDKARIVAASRDPATTHSVVAQRHGLHARLILVLLFALLLAACGSLGPATVATDRLAYARVTADSAKQQALLNIVRLRYGDYVSFFHVGQVVSGYTLMGEGRVGANIFTRNWSLGDDLSLGALLHFEDRPTITYNPVTGPELAHSMLNPFPPGELFLMLAAAPRPPRAGHHGPLRRGAAQRPTRGRAGRGRGAVLRVRGADQRGRRRQG